MVICNARKKILFVLICLSFFGFCHYLKYKFVSEKIYYYPIEVIEKKVNSLIIDKTVGSKEIFIFTKRYEINSESTRKALLAVDIRLLEREIKSYFYLNSKWPNKDDFLVLLKNALARDVATVSFSEKNQKNKGQFFVCLTKDGQVFYEKNGIIFTKNFGPLLVINTSDPTSSSYFLDISKGKYLYSFKYEILFNRIRYKNIFNLSSFLAPLILLAVFLFFIKKLRFCKKTEQRKPIVSKGICFLIILIGLFLLYFSCVQLGIVCRGTDGYAFELPQFNSQDSQNLSDKLEIMKKDGMISEEYFLNAIELLKIWKKDSITETMSNPDGEGVVHPENSIRGTENLKDEK